MFLTECLDCMVKYFEGGVNFEFGEFELRVKYRAKGKGF